MQRSSTGGKFLKIKYTPLLIVCLLVAVVGFGMRERSSRAIAPPIYDALSYFDKGEATWKALKQGKIFGTLNVEPTRRPPGTTLMSFPFGFNPDFHGFLFRSVFIPIFVWGLALGIAIRPVAKSSSARWLGMGLVAALLSMPMFYHFEPRIDYPGTDLWGFQDTFFAALAALAVAVLVTAARKRSILLLMVGTVAGAWTILVKPTGILLMPVCLWFWALELGARNWPLQTAWRSDPIFRRHVYFGLCFQLALYSFISWICFHSEYLSEKNIAVGILGLKVLIEMEKGSRWQDVVFLGIRTAFGWHWFIMIGILIFVSTFTALKRVGSRKVEPADIRLFGALLALSGGVAWWILFAGGPDSIRYIYPFALVALVIVAPDFVAMGARLPAKWSAVLGLVLAIPLALIGAALHRKHSLGIERLLSINLATGQFAEEVKIAEYLLGQARAGGNEIVKVYNLPRTGPLYGVVEGVWDLRQMADPRLPALYSYGPEDWEHLPTVRRRQLTGASYVFFEPFPKAEAEAILSGYMSVPDFEVEVAIFTAWLDTLGESEGVQEGKGRSPRVLKVVDPKKFDAAYCNFVAQRHWRDYFLKENTETQEEKLIRRFYASSAPLLMISGYANADQLRVMNHLTITTESDGVLLRSTGPDPYLDFPQFQIPSGKRGILRVAVTVPKPAHLQISCFSSELASSSLRVLESDLHTGKNGLYFDLPDDSGPLRLRFLPGSCEGGFLLRKLEVRAIDPGP